MFRLRGCNLRLMLIRLVVFLGVFATASYASPITMTVHPSIAPNVFDSPSWLGYLANAMNSLEHNLGNIGSQATDPTAYEIMTSFDPRNIISSVFPSWKAQAYPASPFNLEYGNRIHWGLHLVGDGTKQFELANLWNHMFSNDPGSTFTPPVEGFFDTSSYGPDKIGISYGVDRIRGTGDDIIYTSGNPHILVDELIYVGVGNSYWATSTGSPTEQQADLDAIVAYMNSFPNFMVGNTYCLYENDHETAIICGNNVPEPASALLLAAGLLTLLGARRLKKRH